MTDKEWDNTEGALDDLINAIASIGGQSSKVEPSADIRHLATRNYEIYIAHVDVGFTKDEALSIVNNIMTSVMMIQFNKDDDDNGD